VIIDGRIADVCDTGFVDGTIVIPQFVLKELQLVADSGDSMKRNRGRRGLDILQRIQKMSGVEVMISDVDFPDVREVDLKLIELARTLQGKIVTNDFNLNKVAQLRGVSVLNVNELANSLKPVVLPGEQMKVFILKEGKEYNQGVALPGRRHDGRGRQRAPDDQQDDRHRRHQRAADHRRQDDLRPVHRRQRRRPGPGAGAAERSRAGSDRRQGILACRAPDVGESAQFTISNCKL
jgi:rRNA-processing protein FCF1